MNEKVSFESALARIGAISAALNSRETPLEESVKLYGEAIRLIDVCKKRIETAKLTVERLDGKENGS